MKLTCIHNYSVSHMGMFHTQKKVLGEEMTHVIFYSLIEKEQCPNSQFHLGRKM